MRTCPAHTSILLIAAAFAVPNAALSAEKLGASPPPGAYPATPQETAAGTSIDPRYEPGNILRYGADPTGRTSSDAAMEQALRASTAIYIPHGSYLSEKQIMVPNGVSIYGLDRSGTEWRQVHATVSA